MPSTAAQDEFNALFHGTGRGASPSRPHPEDANSSSADEKRAAGASPARAALPRSIRQSARDHNNNASDSDSAVPRAGKVDRRRCHIPAHRRDANTGPKGVIADAQAFEQARRAARRAAGSTVSLLPPPSATALPSSAAAMMLARRGGGGGGVTDKEARRGSWLANLSESEDEDGASGDELEYEEGDDQFLERWRQARLRELATGNGRPAGAAGRERSPLPPGAGGPRFGAVVAVDAIGFLDVVESSAPTTVVVVFIYDDMVSPFPPPDPYHG
jgi:hypothetical protein